MDSQVRIICLADVMVSPDLLCDVWNWLLEDKPRKKLKVICSLQMPCSLLHHSCAPDLLIRVDFSLPHRKHKGCFI
jgi:hypothetical protein